MTDIDIGFLESSALWRDAVLSACLGGVLLAYLGFFIVTNHASFVSATVSQLAGLGVVLSIFLGAVIGVSISPLILPIVLGMAGATLFALPKTSSQIPTDAILASVMIGASALVFIFARYLSQDYQHIQKVLFGDAVIASKEELYSLIIVSGFVLVTHGMFRQRLLFVLFDPQTAKMRGMNVNLWGWFLGLSIGLSVALVTRSLGALPTFAFSVIPVVSALLIVSRVRTIMWVSCSVALLSAFLGYYIAFVQDLPVGSSMVTVMIVILVCSAIGRLLIKRWRCSN